MDLKVDVRALEADELARARVVTTSLHHIGHFAAASSVRARALVSSARGSASRCSLRPDRGGGLACNLLTDLSPLESTARGRWKSTCAPRPRKTAEGHIHARGPASEQDDECSRARASPALQENEETRTVNTRGIARRFRGPASSAADCARVQTTSTSARGDDPMRRGRSRSAQAPPVLARMEPLRLTDMSESSKRVERRHA